MAKKHCIILLTLCLLLSACGAVEEPGYSITSAPDPVAADSPEPGELRYALSDFGSGAEGCNVLRSGDLLFYIYEDYSAGIDDPKTTLSVSELDGNGLRMLSDFNGSWLRTCCADQDGGLWALSYASLDDGSPELLHFDGDGTELARFSIDGSYIPAGCYHTSLPAAATGRCMFSTPVRICGCSLSTEKAELCSLRSTVSRRMRRLPTSPTVERHSSTPPT